MVEKLREEFINGKTWFDWCFLALGLILQIIAIIYGYVSSNPDSVACIISGLTGIVSVVLCAEGKISFYLFGYIQLLTYVFAIAIPYHLWGEVGENIFYFVTMIIGTIIWFKNYGKDNEDSSKVESKLLNKKGWIISLVTLVISTIVLGVVLQNTSDPTPWFDSITTTAPLIAQILLMFGYREQWGFWIIEDIMSLVMFIILGNWIMVAQYLFWTVNCVYGWVKWTNNAKHR